MPRDAEGPSAGTGETSNSGLRSAQKREAAGSEEGAEQVDTGAAPPRAEFTKPLQSRGDGVSKSPPPTAREARPHGSRVVSPSPGSAAVLLEERDRSDYAKRLRDSIGFFERAVSHPVRIDPAVVRGTFMDPVKAYLTPAGILLVEDSAGKTSSRSLLELSTDEALRVMGEAMKVLKEEGITP